MGEIDSFLNGPKKPSESERFLGPAKPDASIGDVLKQAGASAIEGIGAIPQFGGEIVAKGLNLITGSEDFRAENPLGPISKAIRDSMTEGGKAAMADTFKGDVLDPSSWQLPETGSGLAMGVAQGVGSLGSTLIPLGAARAVGMGGKALMGAGAAAGAATTGGAAAGDVRENLSKMTEEQWALVPAYQQALNGGLSPDQARSHVTNEAALYSGLISSVAGGIGGAFNARILDDLIAKKGLTMVLGKVSDRAGVRAAVGGAGGFVGEGLQEGLEKVGQNVGENIGMGKSATDNVTRDTFGDVAMGAIVGGKVGAVTGVASKHLVTQPGDMPEINAANGPMSAAARSAIDGGASATVQTTRIAEEAAAADKGKQSNIDLITNLGDDGLRALVANASDRGTVAELIQSVRNPKAPAALRERAADMLVQITGLTSKENLTGGEADAFRTSAPGQGPVDFERTGKVADPMRSGEVSAPGLDLVSNDALPYETSGPIQQYGSMGKGFNLNKARLLATVASNQKTPMTVIPHADGEYTVIPTRLLDGKSRAQFAGLQPKQLRALPAPTAPAENVITVDSAGTARPTTVSVEEDMAARGVRQSEAARKAELGLTPDVEAAQMRRAAPDPATIAQAANEAATSPMNDLPEPTPAQADAGNYKKGHISLHGMNISIENPAGSTRSGTDADGKAWSTDMKQHYGYIRRTTGNDGDHVDTFIGENPESDVAFVVDQQKPKTGKFDEHKVMLGFNTQADAEAAYKANYSAGWQGMQSITQVPVSRLKEWLKTGDTTKPFAAGRADAARRKKVADMTPEERSKELLTDPLTGLHNGRWMDENRDQFSHVVAFDADGLKWVNDNMGHASGDELLKAYGRALQRVSENSVKLRDGGDEFFILASSQDEAENMARQVEDLLAQSNIKVEKDGELIEVRGIGVSYGIAEEVHAADQRLNESKRAREASGKRSARGEQLPTVVRTPAGGRENRVDQASGRVNEPAPASDSATRSAVREDGRAPDHAGGRKPASSAAERGVSNRRVEPPQSSAPDGATSLGAVGYVSAKNGQPVTLRDNPKPGTLYIGNEPALDFDSGFEVQYASAAEALADLAKNPRRFLATNQRFFAGADPAPKKRDLTQDQRDSLTSLRAEVGWSERGGKMIRNREGDVVERTKWIPISEFWPGYRTTGGKLTELQGRLALDKAAEGKTLNRREKELVKYALMYLEHEMQPQEVAQTGFNELSDAEQRQAVDALAEMEDAVSLDGQGKSLPASMPDAEFEAELDKIFGVESRREDKRPESQASNVETVAQSASSRGPPGENQSAEDARGREALELKGESEVEIQAREAAQAETQRATLQADQEAEQRAAADRERGSFALTGSERPADTLAAAGQTDLFNQPAEKAPAQASEKSSTKPAIEDFGEKIAGARKEYGAEFRAKLADAAEVDVATEPLSKSWPEPDYQKLIDAGLDGWAVAFAHAARDEVPTKPKSSWKLKGWVAETRMLRDFTADIINGRISPDVLRAKLSNQRWAADLHGRIELYQAVGHENSLKGVRIRNGSYSVYAGQEFKPPKTIWTIEKKAQATAFSNWPTELASGDTREAAIAVFKKKLEGGALEKEAAKPQTKFDIYSYRGKNDVVVGKKIGKNYIDLKTFTTVAEARKYLAENQVELERLLEKVKEIPSERRETNAPRVGEDHRYGADVTPQQFTDAFGFRGVQFGNYVEGARRQSDLNQAYDALMDMAGVLGIPSKAISLNGELGLAFGARGIGGKRAPSAHYEPGQVVINLTKSGGAGSLAHEWFHAVDNYFSRIGGRKLGYLTKDFRSTTPGVRQEMLNAFRDVMTAINSTEMPKRALVLDRKRSKPYWSTDLEMAARAYETYIAAKLQDQSASNDYLANIVDEKVWEAASQLGLESEDSYPYPTTAEMPAIRAAFDHFFDVVETKETDKGIALGNIAGAADGKLDGSLFRAIEGGAGATELLGMIERSSNSPLNREVAALLLKHRVNPTIETGDDNLKFSVPGRAMAAAYIPGRDAVRIIRNEAVEQNLVHEIMHAATVQALRKGGMAAGQMKTLFERVKQNGALADEYGMSNVDEFVAEAFSNPNFQAALKTVKVPSEGRTLWQWFVGIVRGLLGLDTHQQDALSQALEIGTRLVRESDRTEGPAMGAPVQTESESALGNVSVDDVRQKVADLMQSQNSFNKWWHKTVGTQYHKAKVDRDFGRVYEAGQRYLQDVSQFAMDAADFAQDLLPKLGTVRDVFRAGPGRVDLEKVSKAVFGGTLAENPHVYSDEELTAQGLNAKQIGLYRQFRAAVDKSLNDMIVSEAARLARGRIPDAIVQKAKAAADPYVIADALVDVGDEPNLNLAREIDEKVQRMNQIRAEGYAPLMRFGDHTVDVVDAAGNRLYFAMFESQAEANRMAREFREMAADKDPKYGEYRGSTIVQGLMSKEASQLFQGLSPDSLELFAEAVGAEQAEVFQEFLKLTLNNRSAMKRLIERKGIAGFNEDAQRVLAQFVTSNARLAAKNYNYADMLKAANDIPKEKGDVKDEAVRLVKYLQNPQEEAAGLRGLLFVNFIGGSIASSLTNMTQPLMMTLPYLSQFSGTAQAGAALARAAKVATGGKAEGALATAIEKATKEGVIAPHELHQLYAEGIRGFGNNKLLRRALRVWGGFFSLSETFNRRITFAAAFEVAQGDGLAQINKEIIAQNSKRDAAGLARLPVFESAYDFAKHAIEETQGVYNRGNRPNWARGAVGATLFTFKQYSIAYLEFLKRLPPQQKALALGLLVLAAGLQGLPFADDLEDLIDTIGQSMGYNTNSKKALREFAAQTLGDGFGGFVTHGFSSLPGVPLDVQARLGLSNLIPGTGLFKASTPDKGKDVLEIAGPVGSLIQSFGQGFDKIQDGKLREAMGSLAPLAVKNLMKGVDMAQSGYYKDEKGRRVIDTTAYEAAIKAIGFQPSTVARETRKIREAQQDVDMVKQTEGNIAEKWAQGIVEKDPAKQDQARADLFRWNTMNPDSKIRITPAQIHRRVLEMQKTRADRFLKAAPKELRAKLATEIQ